MRRIILAMMLVAAAGAGSAEDVRTAWLESGGGDRIEVARITLDGTRYEIDWADAPFADHFLSMRPFRCIEGPEKHWCHVPYPYEIRRDIAEDLIDLEYDFLFIWKGAGEYGIDTWNGVYYRLEDEGEQLIGRLHEIDMNVLSAPPPEGDLRPVREMDLEPGDPEGHWLPRLVIE